MKAIKIDVVKKTITEIEMEDGFDAMCKELESTGYDRVRLSKSESLWVDDEGLLRKNPLGTFKIEGYPLALSGHGLIIGLDSAGYSVSTRLAIEEIIPLITFVSTEILPEPIIKFYTL